MLPKAFPWTCALSATLCLLALLCAQGALAQSLVLNTDGAPPHSRPGGTGFEDRIVAESFRRIGVPVKLVRLPSERCLQNANAGIDDGTYVRIAGLERQYPDLVMVPEPMSEMSFTAFTRDPDLAVRGWADLRRLQVTSVTGWRLVEQHLADAKNLHRVRDEEALFAQLAKGRVQVGVAGLHTGLEIIRRRGYTGIRALSPPLESPPMHLYLHTRHAALVPRLAEALRQMRREGVIQRLTREGLAEAQP